MNSFSETNNCENFFRMSQVCCELGSFHVCNYAYAKLLNTRINETGNTIEELTVKELLALHEKCGVEFNKKAIQK